MLLVGLRISLSCLVWLLAIASFIVRLSVLAYDFVCLFVLFVCLFLVCLCGFAVVLKFVVFICACLLSVCSIWFYLCLLYACLIV